MNKMLLVLFAIISLIISCSKGDDSTTNKSVDNQVTATGQIIKLKVNIEEEKELQQAVDNGHQPWRLDPVDVAHVTLMGVDKNIVYENCTLISETGNESIVKCIGAKTYVVYLKRIVRTKNGIWTATQIEILR